MAIESALIDYFRYKLIAVIQNVATKSIKLDPDLMKRLKSSQFNQKLIEIHEKWIKIIKNHEIHRKR